MTRTCRYNALALVVFCLVGVVGCGDVAREDRELEGERDPFIVQTDSITLTETDDFLIGRPWLVTLDRLGRIYVSDGSTSSVLQFDKSGRALRKYGRKGQGPGELTSAGPALVLGDSLLVVADGAGNDKIVFYSLESGEMVREVSRVGLVSSLVEMSGGLLLGRMDIANKTSAAILRFDRDTLEAIGPIPSEYFESPMLAGDARISQAALTDDGIVIGAAGSGKLFRQQARGAAFDSLLVPAVRRRGVPVNIVELYNKPTSMETRASLSSMLWQAGALDDGWLGLVHVDFAVKGNAVTGRSFLSMLRWSDRTACVDREVSLTGHTRPVVGISRGTFVVLDQVVTDGPRPTTTVRFFTPDFKRCVEQATAINPF